MAPDTALTLQGISWSEVPHQGGAVICSRVIKGRKTVEGYTVIRIEPDDIVVGRVGQQGRVLFRQR